MIFNFPDMKYRNNILSNEEIKDNYLHGWCEILQEVFCTNINNVEKYVVYESYIPNHPDTMYGYNEGEYWDDHFCFKWNDKFIDIQGVFNNEREYLISYIKNIGKDNIIDCYLEKINQKFTQEIDQELLIFTQKIVESMLFQINENM